MKRLENPEIIDILKETKDESRKLNLNVKELNKILFFYNFKKKRNSEDDNSFSKEQKKDS